MNSDKPWIRFGERDPYLKTVTTLDPYKLDPTLPSGAAAYLASGERYVRDLFATIERHVVRAFAPAVAVDFGCSVGRIAIPLAGRCGSVTGVDISPDALAEAAKNARQAGVENVRWVLSDDALSRVPARLGFFHSYNVLQHLPVERGLAIVRRALERLDAGGVIAVHVPYADLASRARRAINWAQAHLPVVHAAANLARGRPMDYPLMLMNAYPLGTLLSLLRKHGCVDVHCKLIDQGRYPGAIVIARLPEAPGPRARSGSTTDPGSA